jgi:hypothetical protein
MRTYIIIDATKTRCLGLVVGEDNIVCFKSFGKLTIASKPEWTVEEAKKIIGKTWTMVN